MALFAEILCRKTPKMVMPSVNSPDINKLIWALKYNTTYHRNIQLVYQIFFLPYNEFAELPKKYANRFEILQDVVLNNLHITDEEKDKFLEKFGSAQRAYAGFRRLATRFRFKHTKRFEVYTDLCCVEFSVLSPKILISLLDRNTLYRFRISDIINIIDKALTYAPHFFAEPYEIKNPYTNLPFSRSNLYNIYFTLLDSTYIMPILFQLYFLSNFCLERFKNENECFIRDKSIANFVKHASQDDRHNQINRMFYAHQATMTCVIHPQFPREKLVRVFASYLRSFLLEEYSLNPAIRDLNRTLLDERLVLFSRLNPNFGRKIWGKRLRRAEQDDDYPLVRFVFNETVAPMPSPVQSEQEDDDRDRDRDDDDDDDDDNTQDDDDDDRDDDTIVNSEDIINYLRGIIE